MKQPCSGFNILIIDKILTIFLALECFVLKIMIFIRICYDSIDCYQTETCVYETHIIVI